MKQTSAAFYDPLSRALHWATAVFVAIAFVLGPEGFGQMLRKGIDPATQLDVVWHETLGVTIFTLTLLRLVWVALRPAAPITPMATWMKISSKLVHLALWALMLALPITAILALGSEGHPLTLLGGFRIDSMPWIEESALGELADWGDVHGWLGDAIAWIAGAHAAAAIYHHAILKDGLLQTMLPILKRR